MVEGVVAAELPFEQSDPLRVPPRLRELQSEGAVHRVRTAVGDAAWLVTGYAPVRQLLDDDRLTSAGRDRPTSPSGTVPATAWVHPWPASSSTPVCTLGLCGFPDERVAIAEMHRVLRPTGTVLLLDHVGSHHRVIRFGQRLLEKLTVRMLGDYQTRRPLPLLEQVGFVIHRSERLKAGTVERVAAVKPAAEGI